MALAAETGLARVEAAASAAGWERRQSGGFGVLYHPPGQPGRYVRIEFSIRGAVTWASTRSRHAVGRRKADWAIAVIRETESAS